MKIFNTTTRGFTLIELLVVISIIGLLSSIVLGSLSAARAKARDATRMHDLSQIRAALELYASENNGYYPLNICTTTSGICNGYSVGQANLNWIGTSAGCANYNDSNITMALTSLVTRKYLPYIPADPKPVPASGFCYEYYGVPNDASTNPLGIGYKLRILGTLEGITDTYASPKHPYRDMAIDTVCGVATPPVGSSLRKSLAIGTAGVTDPWSGKLIECD